MLALDVAGIQKQHILKSEVINESKPSQNLGATKNAPPKLV
jgi:hypothetical protein